MRWSSDAAENERYCGLGAREYTKCCCVMPVSVADGSSSGQWLVASGRCPVAGGRCPVSGGRCPVAGWKAAEKVCSANITVRAPFIAGECYERAQNPKRVKGFLKPDTLHRRDTSC